MEVIKEMYTNLYSEQGKQGTAWPAKTELIRRLVELGNEIGTTRAIEFGCGMGQDAMALYNATGWLVSATDASSEMLSNVSHQIDVFVLEVTDPEAYPVAAYDLGFGSFIVHLLNGAEKLVFHRGVFKALRPGGIFVLLTASEEDLRRRRITYYFPSALAIDRKRYLTINENQMLLCEAGFSEICSEPVLMGKMVSGRELTMFEERTCSILRLIPDAEYRRGMARLRDDLLREKEALDEQTPDHEWKRTLLIARK